ncbi:MAG: prepilin-type N-terminal cleavage/methylation domain-containing protein [Sandaracinaceae bacterium]|nr:MAG: prepilin-type N-terminal cleavage/methylation domain-containing protein [Sandaracinaceae bacterium]
MQRRIRRRSRRAGMTLVEIMIVVIIMSLIATAVGMAVIPMIVRARIEQASTDAATIRGVAEMWLIENGTCPSVSELVDEGVLRDGTRTLDPWDSPWSLECERTSVHVTSAGPDRELGTEDDIPVEEG